MAVFKLTEATIERLRTKFQEFQQERRKVHELLINYVADYRQFQGSPMDRKEYLEGRYARRAMTHLLWADEEPLWQVGEIALLLGRNQSSISRTMTKLEAADAWCSRLLSLQKSVKSANGNNVYVYRQGIFDLIFDHYEEEYLMRFSEPRRGDPAKAPDAKEVRRFWNYLKAQVQIEGARALDSTEEVELADLPPMGWRAVLSLIWDKVFTVKTGTMASLVLAVAFELARRWSALTLWVVVGSSLSLTLCAALLRLRKGRASVLSDCGAVAMLFTLLWGAGLLSSEGVIRAPDGATLVLHQSASHQNEQKLTLIPMRGKGKEVDFRVSVSHREDVKELFYRISPETEYRSTGINERQFSNMRIETGRSEGTVRLDVKYLDARGEERGPWAFSFDLERERFNLSKQFLLQRETSWLTLSRMTGVTSATLFIPARFVERGVVKTLVYGINTDKPKETLQIPEPTNAPVVFLRTGDEGVKYVTAYLIFEDGTSSDIRRIELKPPVAPPSDYGE